MPSARTPTWQSSEMYFTPHHTSSDGLLLHLALIAYVDYVGKQVRPDDWEKSLAPGFHSIDRTFIYTHIHPCTDCLNTWTFSPLPLGSTVAAVRVLLSCGLDIHLVHRGGRKGAGKEERGGSGGCEWEGGREGKNGSSSSVNGWERKGWKRVGDIRGIMSIQGVYEQSQLTFAYDLLYVRDVPIQISQTCPQAYQYNDHMVRLCSQGRMT